MIKADDSTSGGGRRRRSGRRWAFLWFGLPDRAAESRWAALGGLVITVAVFGTVYGAVNRFAAWRGFSIFDPQLVFVFGGRSLDSRIPFWPWTLFVYVTHLLFYLLPVFAYPLTKQGARRLFDLYGGLIEITLIACLFFLLLPAEMALRQAVDPDEQALLGRLFEWAHRLDTPYNTWPCLHVAQPGLIVFAVWHWIQGRAGRVVLLVWWAAIGLSTLTTRQHYLFDVLTGFVLVAAYAFWFMKEGPDRQMPEKARNSRA